MENIESLKKAKYEIREILVNNLPNLYFSIFMELKEVANSLVINYNKDDKKFILNIDFNVELSKSSKDKIENNVLSYLSDFELISSQINNKVINIKEINEHINKKLKI